MILLLDNYDSFTYNIVQYLAMAGAEVAVRRNNDISPAAARQLPLSGIVISPGPGRPEDAGCALDMIHSFAGSVPILGVCLGHQALGVAFGAHLVRAPKPVHGRASPVRHDGCGIFRKLPADLTVGRYHSLVLEAGSIHAPLVVSATSLDDGQVMGIRHSTLPLEGVQFHPESVATPAGRDLLQNFVRACRASARTATSATSGVSS